MGADDASFWSNLFQVMHRCDDPAGKCTLCQFTGDLRSQCEGVSLSVEDLLSEKVNDLKAEEEALTTQVEVQQHAKDKMLVGLNQIETKLSGLMQKKEAVTQTKGFARAALQSLSTSTLRVQVETLKTKYDTSEDDQKIEAALWVLKANSVTGDTLTEGLKECEAYCESVMQRPFPSNSISQWLEIITHVIRRMTTDLPSLQSIEMRCLINIARRANHHDQSALVADTVIQCQGMQALLQLLQSVNDEVKATACLCVHEVCVTDEGKAAFCHAGGIERLVSIVDASRNEVVLTNALKAMWAQARTEPNREVLRASNAIKSVLALLQEESELLVEHACVALGYLTLDTGNMAVLKTLHGIDALIGTLYWPNHTIQTHAAGALWHCAANDADNRALIRNKGGIASLLDLLRCDHESVVENASGALWNCVVDEENTKTVHALGGLQQLIGLLYSDQPSLVENASGTLSKCCELHQGTRAAMRKYKGLQRMLELMDSPNTNPGTFAHAASAVRHCARNENNKAELVSLGGVKVIINQLSRVSDEIAEDLLCTLLICSIREDVKRELHRVSGLEALLTCIQQPSNILREKAMATVRNCTSLPEVRQSLVGLNALPIFLRILEPDAVNVTSELREYTVAALWNIAREDEVKNNAHRDGVLQAAIQNVDLELGESVIENAAGALHSLTMLVLNREACGELGGIHNLLRITTEAASGDSGLNPFVLENVLAALKNCTCDNSRNQVLVQQLHGIPGLVELLNTPSETVVKECALCLKNLAVHEPNSVWIGEQGGIACLVKVAQRTDIHETTRKSAYLALSELSQCPRNRELMQDLWVSPNPP